MYHMQMRPTEGSDAKVWNLHSSGLLPYFQNVSYYRMLNKIVDFVLYQYYKNFIYLIEINQTLLRQFSTNNPVFY